MLPSPNSNSHLAFGNGGPIPCFCNKAGCNPNKKQSINISIPPSVVKRAIKSIYDKLIKKTKDGRFSIKCPKCLRYHSLKNIRDAKTALKKGTQCFKCSQRQYHIKYTDEVLKSYGITKFKNGYVFKCLKKGHIIKYRGINYRFSIENGCSECRRLQTLQTNKKLFKSNAGECWVNLEAPFNHYQLSNQGRVLNVLTYRILNHQKVGIDRVYETVLLHSPKANKKWYYIHNLLKEYFNI